MRKRICKEVCPSCKSSEFTTYKRKDQFYCSKCDSYYKLGSTNSELSKNTVNLLKALMNLFLFNAKKPITLKAYRKKVENRPLPPNMNQSHIETCQMGDYNRIVADGTCDIDTSIQNAVILVRKGNDFVVVKNLGIGKGIAFENAIVHIEPVWD